MTTNVYWSEVEHGEPAATFAFWAEIGHANEPTAVYWAEVESTSEVGEAVTGSGQLPEIYSVTLVGGAATTVGGTVDLTIQVTDQDGDPIANVLLSPVSDDTGIATVTQLAATDANGEATVRATGVAIGAADITVVGDGLVTPYAQTVTVLDVTTVTLTVPTISLEIGTTGSASVSVLDQNGDPMADVAVTWSSTTDAVIADPSPSTTNAAGTATVSLPALAEGTTTITATAGGITTAGTVITVFTVADPPTYSAEGSATIVVTAESRLAGWERPKVRRFNDADQKKTYPTDRFFEGMAESAEVDIVWPTAALLRRLA